MESSDFDAIFIALQAAHVRYIVVGGVAVVLHGSPRFTADLDLVIALEDANVRAALTALEHLGYRARAPVPATQFADPEMRRSWIEDKGLTVFSLWSPDHPATEIDLFVEEPFPFDEAYARAIHADLGTSTVTVASIADLIALKHALAGPKISLISAHCRPWLWRMAMANNDGWAAHEREQRRTWRVLTPAQRLAWLWQAKLFARRALGRARVTRKPALEK